MPFTALFIAHAPDADPAVHRGLVDTGLYRLFSVVVRDTDQAIAVSRELIDKEGVQSILLCPGNSHDDVARMAAATGPDISVSVARGDARSGRVAAKAMQDAGWFAQAPA